jgi:excinuclease ABC subunit A
VNQRATAEAADAIEVDGARTHNLRDVSCRFPHRCLTVVTGVSGSGKSSLAFDTVYAEGQRRYVETLSTYARQFLQQMRKPPVDAIRHLPPSLALRQGNSVNNARSTVGTVTEVVDHLQLLFSAVGVQHCVACDAVVRPNSPRGVAEALVAAHDGARVVIGAVARPAPDETMGTLLRQLAAEGHRRLLVDGELVEIDAPEAAALLDAPSVTVVIDRLQVRAGESRIVEAVETAFQLGDQLAVVVLWDRRTDADATLTFHAGYRCDACGTSHLRPVPALFHTQSKVGACPTCEGYGRTVGIDEARVVPDPRRTIADGALACFAVPSAERARGRLFRACMDRGVSIDTPWMRLPEEDRDWILHGGKGWDGVDGFFESLESDRYKPHVRIFMARFRGYTRCASCGGSGLSAQARAVRIGGRSLPQVLALRLEQVADWLAALDLGAETTRALDALLRELRDRVGFLVGAGVGYLTLARPARTLSGGEMHRVLLATSVGRLLTDTCYVLDEPTAGLHPRDTGRLLGVLEQLRDAGNTVVVVEHDPDVIERADWLVEVGPEAGARGGNVVYEGTLDGLRARGDTATGAMLSRRTDVAWQRLPRAEAWLELSGACLNNLRDVSVAFPKRRFTVVTGVSGSGKSSLVTDVLCGRLLEARGTRPEIDLGPADVRGDDFREVIVVDQGSVARSSRSCALTFCGAYSAIRDVFAATDAALDARLTAGAFSFNTPGGRCERCEGTGVLTVEMHFLADVDLTCDVCDGRRFGPDVLRVTVEGQSIADVFEMTVDDAIDFFAGRAAVTRRLEPLARVGLGYLRLGQPTTQLSGGELQRLKLSSFLAESDTAGGRLFVFDEPTVGLHMRDVARLVDVIHALRDAGNTIIVVEHNLDLVAAADWIVDLGPDAGPDGGAVVYEGPVRGIVDWPTSLTGRHLAESLGIGAP